MLLQVFLLVNIIQMGQGQSGKAIAGLGDVASLALERAKAEGKTAAAEYLGQQQLLGTAVGSGVGLYLAGGGFSDTA